MVWSLFLYFSAKPTTPRKDVSPPTYNMYQTIHQNTSSSSNTITVESPSTRTQAIKPINTPPAAMLRNNGHKLATFSAFGRIQQAWKQKADNPQTTQITTKSINISQTKSAKSPENKTKTSEGRNVYKFIDSKTKEKNATPSKPT